MYKKYVKNIGMIISLNCLFCMSFKSNAVHWPAYYLQRTNQTPQRAYLKKMEDIIKKYPKITAGVGAVGLMIGACAIHSIATDNSTPPHTPLITHHTMQRSKNPEVTATGDAITFPFETKDDRGNTSLLRAIREGEYAHASKLLCDGANASAQNRLRQNALTFLWENEKYRTSSNPSAQELLLQLLAKNMPLKLYTTNRNILVPLKNNNDPHWIRAIVAITDHYERPDDEDFNFLQIPQAPDSDLLKNFIDTYVVTPWKVMTNGQITMPPTKELDTTGYAMLTRNCPKNTALLKQLAEKNHTAPIAQWAQKNNLALISCK